MSKEESQKIIIDNLKKQIETKRSEIMDRNYKYIIKKVINDKFPEKPLTFIEGSDRVYSIDSIDSIIDYCTMFEED